MKDLNVNLDNTTFKQERLMQERKNRSDAINRVLFDNKEEMEAIKGRLAMSMSFNFVFLLIALVTSLVKSTQAWVG